MCHISRYAVIHGTKIYWGFRCSTHKLADGRRFGVEENVDSAITEHKESKQK